MESPKKTLSEKDIREIVDILCEDIPKIFEQPVLGRGREGTVYQWCISSDNCNYAVKIQQYIKGTDIDDIHEVMKKTNKANNIGLAPRIYRVRECPNRVILQLMDKVQGRTLENYLENDEIDKRSFDLFLNEVKKLHSEAKLYHGDLNPQNTFFDGKDKFTFIDFNIKYKGYKKYYDYALLLHYLNVDYKDSKLPNKKELYKYFVDRIFNMIGMHKSSANDLKIQKLLDCYYQLIEDYPNNFSNFLRALSNVVRYNIN